MKIIKNDFKQHVNTKLNKNDCHKFILNQCAEDKNIFHIFEKFVDFNAIIKHKIRANIVIGDY